MTQNLHNAALSEKKKYGVWDFSFMEDMHHDVDADNDNIHT